MSTAPPRVDNHPHRPLWHRPLAIAAAAVVTWVVLVFLSEELWRHAFGFPGREALALSVGLFAYLAIFVGVMVLIATTLARER